MYRNKDFLERLYQEPLKFDFEGERLYVQKVELGGLAIDDGTLLVGDPYKINYGIKVVKDIPKGIYPVMIYSATFPPHEEHKILALKVMLKEEVPDTFKMALPEGIVAESLGENDYYGVRTESGNIMILDETTCTHLMTEVEESYTLVKEMEEKLSLSYFEVGGMADVKLTDKEKNFMCVVSGNDKGAYPVYLAYKDETLVSIVIDFMHLD